LAAQKYPMMVVIIVCGIVAMILPWVFLGKITAVYEQARLIAIDNGEVISKFYGCRGCSQHITFSKKYTPHLMRKLWIYNMGAVLSFFVPAVIIIAIVSNMK
jgi:hypothetical protein